MRDRLCWRLGGAAKGAVLVRWLLPTLLGQVDSSPHTTRRDFLRWTVAGVATFALAESVAAFVAFFWSLKAGAFGSTVAIAPGSIPGDRRGSARQPGRALLADQQPRWCAGALLEVRPPGLHRALERDRGGLPLPLPRLGLRPPWQPDRRVGAARARPDADQRGRTAGIGQQWRDYP